MQAKKFDEDKPPMALLPGKALMEVAKVLSFGEKKYGTHNWLKGMRWTRLTSAGFRHTFKWLAGEDLDDESGLNHMAHAACCFLMILEYIVRGVGEDDRYKEGNRD